METIVDPWLVEELPEIVDHLRVCGSGGPSGHPGRCPLDCQCPCHLAALDMVAMKADQFMRKNFIP